MPLIITPEIQLPEIAPGPHIEVVVAGINGNLVPDPAITSTTIWPAIIAGTSTSGVAIPQAPSFWSRQTASFVSAPASLRLQTTTTLASQNCYITPFIVATPGQSVTISVRYRVATNDGRIPRVHIVPRNAGGTVLTEGIFSGSSTVSGSFGTITGTYVLPADTANFRVHLTAAGTAVSQIIYYWDDLSVILQAGAKYISINRVWEGQEEPIQGGASNTIIGDTMFFIDYAAPFGVDIIYKVYTFDETTFKEVHQSLPVKIDLVDTIWISHPVSPELACRVVPDSVSMKTRTFGVAGGGAIGMVSRDKRVAITGPTQEAGEIPINFLTYTPNQYAAAHAVLDNTNPFMMRSSPGHNLPGMCYIYYPSFSETFIDAPLGNTARISMMGTLVESPAHDFIVSVRTYEDWLEYSSYAVLPWATYLEGLRG